MAKIQHIKHLSNFKSLIQKSEELKRCIKGSEQQRCIELSNVLVRKGEFRLLRGDRSGLDFFNLALKIAPLHLRLYVDQGLALFEYGSHYGNEDELSLASQRFKMATTLDSSCFEAWHLWGNTLYFLGIKREEPSYFFCACKKYEKAIALSKGQPADIVADLYWDYGNLWTKLAEISEEATDYHIAIKAYEKVLAFQEDLSMEFWMNFANTYYILGNKTNDIGLFIKAISYYKNAIFINISSSEGWFKLASTLHTLYDYTHDEDHFSQANECYLAAVRLAQSNKEIYLKWACLLLESGSIFHDIRKLWSCIEKCHRAYHCDKKDPRIMGVWAEALALLGVLTDQFKLINNAKNSIDSFVEGCKDPEIFYSYGMVLAAFGCYYKDCDYYYQSIEYFQKGLSINCTLHRLWYAMGNSAFAAAVLDHDEKSYERACHFFQRALSFKVNSTYHYHYAMCLSKYGAFVQEQKLCELAVYYFEQAFTMQEYAFYLHPEWVFHFAVALDHVTGFIESGSYYVKALELLTHVLMLKPEFPRIHYQIANVYSHYAELSHELELFYRAIHHYRIAHQREQEEDAIVLDWAIALVNIGELCEQDAESNYYFREAECKMIQAVKLGNAHAYYFLACLYSILGKIEGSFCFLEKAKMFDCLPTTEEIIEEEWLKNLRKTEQFKVFLSEIQSNTT